jgi:hypothetical protein
MTICEECGLPMKACSAFAIYRIAIENFQRGQTDTANEYARSARERYDMYIEEWRARRACA